MLVARDDLGRTFRPPQPQVPESNVLDTRVNVGVVADCTRNLATGNAVRRRRQPLLVAFGLGELGQELEPKGSRFGVDAVRTADGHRRPEAHRLVGQHAFQFGQLVKQKLAGTLKRYAQRRVHDVR